MTATTQKTTPVSAISLTLTHIFKKLSPFPEKLQIPRCILSLDLGRSRWVADFRINGTDHLYSFNGNNKREALSKSLAMAREKWGLVEVNDIVACYEIGRDGLWIRDFLETLEVPCVIMTPDVLVEGKSAKGKTDKQDAKRLAERLLHFFEGDLSPEHICVPPRDRIVLERLQIRLRNQLVTDRTAACNRFKALLARFTEVPQRLRLAKVDVYDLVGYDGKLLPEEVYALLLHYLNHWKQLNDQIHEIEKKMVRQVEDASYSITVGKSIPDHERVLGMLFRLHGVGAKTACVLACELYDKQYQSPRQVNSATGLVDIPNASGTISHSRGISRRSNRQIRGILQELAWFWIRLQPDSPETRWFLQRTMTTGARQKKICAVGLARRIAVSIWRYLETGISPDGWRLNGTQGTKCRTGQEVVGA